MANQPNILLITTDTQRTDTLGCMGNQYAISPHLDKLAREGVLFRDAHTSSPVCMPARVSLLTGVHTPIHGTIENGYPRRTDLVTLPDLLAQAGYHSILVGKSHIGPVPDSFATQHILAGEKNGSANDIYGQHLRSHGYARATNHPNPVPEELFCEAFLVDQTIAAIEETQSKGVPFFAWCSMLSPHGPLDPPGRWADAYTDQMLPPLNYRAGEVAGHPRHLKELLGLADFAKAPAFVDDTPNWAYVNARRRLYYGLAAYCDQQIGRLIAYIDQRGLREDTLIIFTSDHGTTLYSHGFDDKHNYYDESWRVPLILSMPGTLPQGCHRQFAIWNDLTATILGAAGVYSPSIQGFDLFTPLTSNVALERQCAVATLYRSCAVSTQRWKLEYYFEEQRGRLFDRANDPQEQTDLWNDSDYQSLRDQIRHALLAWRAELHDVQWSLADARAGGPVARRVIRLRQQLRGTDAERRLSDNLAQIESHL